MEIFGYSCLDVGPERVAPFVPPLCPRCLATSVGQAARLEPTDWLRSGKDGKITKEELERVLAGSPRVSWS